jgi:colanic acid biosynthesis glycosyl transferase WcaI
VIYDTFGVSMYVFVVSAVFPPEPVVSAQTSAQIAKELARRGHQVAVITAFPNRPGGKLYPGYVRKLFQRQKTPEGFELVRCFSILAPVSSMISRFWENLSFGLTGGWVVLTSRHPDVIYANTWPIFATGLLFAIARMRGIPLVISIQDVYPESLIAQQRIQANSWAARVMRWVDGLITRGCQGVIVISEHFETIYRNSRGVEADRVHVVPNWVDEGAIVSDGHPDEFRAEHSIPSDAFVAVYGGNIGVAAGVETIIESVRYLKDIETLYLVIAGRGSNLTACQNLVRKISCSRALFHTPWPVDETAKVLGAADVLVLPTRGNQSLASMPSKLISYMLAARPVIALALPQSDLAKVVERSGCGWVVKPDQPELLAAKIKEVMSMESTALVRRGQAGREFALRHLTRDACLPQVVDILEKAAASFAHLRGT